MSGGLDAPLRLPLVLDTSSLDLAGGSGGEYCVAASTLVITGEGELCTETERGRLCGLVGLGDAKDDCAG